MVQLLNGWVSKRERHNGRVRNVRVSIRKVVYSGGFKTGACLNVWVTQRRAHNVLKQPCSKRYIFKTKFMARNGSLQNVWLFKTYAILNVI